MENIRFELESPIKYSANGQEVECNFIELKEPTGKVTHLCCEIESFIQSGVLKMADMLDDSVIAQAKKEAVEDSAPDADGVLAMMTAGGCDMRKLTISFKELFKQVGLMGGEKVLTESRLDDMSHKDLKKMMGVYAANFIMN